jgi:metal-responsive CopG/Arc/MetJ family transcriptional regulator
MHRIQLPIAKKLLEAVDQARGDVPRTVWIRRAIEQRLARDNQSQQEERK